MQVGSLRVLRALILCFSALLLAYAAMKNEGSVAQAEPGSRAMKDIAVLSSEPVADIGSQDMNDQVQNSKYKK